MLRKLAICVAAALFCFGPTLGLLGVASVMNPAAKASCSDDMPSTTATASVTSEGLSATTASGQTITIDRTQLTRAATIIAVGDHIPGVGRDGIMVALMAALTESSLRMLANTSALPASGNYPNDGDGSDHDSLGLFQMRPSTGWGSVAELMDPIYQVRAFYGGPDGPNRGSPRGLLDIPHWRQMAPARAAQAVEVSAHPDRYAEFEPVARAVLNHLTAGPSVDAAQQVVLPVPAGLYTITNGYGPRIHPIPGEPSMHWGTDFAAEAGTPILAIADGTAAYAGPSTAYGNMILIDHTIDGQKVASMYGHMWDDGYTVAEGDDVSAGEQIGVVGSAGWSTGAHLHLEIRPGGSDQPESSAIDPEAWLSAHHAAGLEAAVASDDNCEDETAADGLPGPPAAFAGLPGGRVPDPSGTGGWVTRPTAHLYSETRRAFPQSGWSCWDAHEWNPASDHPRGKACDITFGNQLGRWPTLEQTQQGWKIAAWLQIYADRLHVAYVIFDGKIWSGDHADEGWRPYTSSTYDTGTPTGGHSDHIHVSLRD